jgi:hypothetical protein
VVSGLVKCMTAAASAPEQAKTQKKKENYTEWRQNQHEKKWTAPAHEVGWTAMPLRAPATHVVSEQTNQPRQQP